MPAEPSNDGGMIPGADRLLLVSRILTVALGGGALLACEFPD